MAMIDWRDIETAPNSEDEILVWSPYFKRYDIVKAEGNLWRYQIDKGDKIRYSHWALLQPPAMKSVRRTECA